MLFLVLGVWQLWRLAVGFHERVDGLVGQLGLELGP